MEIRPIDPRTDARWETPPTRDYRVVFWRQQCAPVGMAQEQIGWAANENDVLDAEDVHQVIEWAEAEAQQRKNLYTLYAKVDRGDDRGLIWLAGIDPTAHSRPNFTRQHPADVTPLHD